ncbi:aldose 1-epimerase [Angomonas deanei]|nr:aldose 1-epimerase [Angomonas deanei]|eukprot:EPY30282.1 aldose 1-epimerase [Angomonas deanei]
MSESPVPAEPVTTQAPPEADICKSKVEPYGDGFLITLKSPNIRVELLSYGASVNSVRVRDPTKKPEEPDAWVETCLGYVSFDECKQPTSARGSTRGRFAGLIGNAEFNLYNTNYKLMQNSGANCMNGGPVGFDKVQWKYIMNEGEDEIGVSFHMTSPHLDQGFPGEIFVTATYTILKGSATLKYSLSANLSDTTPVNATVVNLTNNVYWNLNGVARPASATEKAPLPFPILNHCLKLNANYIADVDENDVPTGDMITTKDTVNDFSELRPIKDGMFFTQEQGRTPWGFNDIIALETWDSTLREAAVLYSPESKLQMTVSTTNPVVQVYTANHFPENGGRLPWQAVSTA